MAYVESHQQIGRHPKTRRAARLLGVSVPTIIGHLHLFWHWCLDYAKDGDLTHADAADIADAALWDGEPDDLFGALLQSGFIDEHDGRLYVHDWGEYGGKLEAKKQRKASNQAAYRSRQKMEELSLVNTSGHVTATLPPRDHNVTAYIREEKNREDKSTSTRPRYETEIPNRPNIESPLAMAVREICNLPAMLSGWPREHLESILPGLEAEGATPEQVREFGRKASGHWCGKDKTSNTLRAPAIKNVLACWREVLALPEPSTAGEIKPMNELMDLQAKYANKTQGGGP